MEKGPDMIAGSTKKSRNFLLGTEIKSHWLVYLGGIAVPLILYAIFVGYPLFDTLRLSFYKWDGLGPREYVGLDNLKFMLQDDNFYLCLVNNLKWILVTLSFPVFGGLLLAVLFNSRSIFLGSTFRALWFLPTTMSLASTGLMFSFILNPLFGGANGALRLLGLDFLVQKWLEDPDIVMYTLIAVYSWSYIGNAIVLFHAGISQIDPEYYELATLEGANPLQTLRLVTIPMIRPVITVVVMLTVMASLKAFDLVLVMTKGGPAKTSNVLAYFMYMESFHKNRFGYGATISVVILLISSIFAIVYLRNIAKGSLQVD